MSPARASPAAARTTSVMAPSSVLATVITGTSGACRRSAAAMSSRSSPSSTAPASRDGDLGHQLVDRRALELATGDPHHALVGRERGARRRADWSPCCRRRSARRRARRRTGCGAGRARRRAAPRRSPRPGRSTTRARAAAASALATLCAPGRPHLGRRPAADRRRTPRRRARPSRTPSWPSAGSASVNDRRRAAGAVPSSAATCASSALPIATAPRQTRIFAVT